jgi:hypothetical protein
MEITLAYKGEEDFTLATKDKDGKDNTASCTFKVYPSDPAVLQTALSVANLRVMALPLPDGGKSKVIVRAENVAGAFETEFEVKVLPSPPVSIDVVPIGAAPPPTEPTTPPFEPGTPPPTEPVTPPPEEPPPAAAPKAGNPHKPAKRHWGSS